MNQQVSYKNSFRKIMNAFSYPGQIETIDIKQNYHTFLNDGTMEILVSLLDPEVSYHLLNAETYTLQEIGLYTSSRHRVIFDTDFLVVSKSNYNNNLKEVLVQLKKGSLENPHESATVIIEVEEIKQRAKLCLKGPGIKDANYIDIPNCEFWLKTRNEINHEFPIGIDFIFVDSSNKCVAVPRTTIVEEV